MITAKHLRKNFSWLRTVIALRTSMKPDKKFLARTKADFLARLSAAKGTVVLVKSGFGGVTKYAVTFGIIVGLNGALIAFAQGANVSPAHPLYPFKRLGEGIALTVAPASQKPYLHQTFAERRLEEMKSVMVASGRNANVVKSLDGDFDNEVNEALKGAEQNNTSTLPFCSSFGSMIMEKRQMEGNEGGTNAQWATFERYCGGTPRQFKVELE